MRRRDFIAGLLLAATKEPALAQETGKVHRIAIVSVAPPVAKMNETSDPAWRAFLGELRRLGYVEGANLQIERYSGEGRVEHFPELARDMVSLKPDVIFATSRKLVLDLEAASTTIPIVGFSADPLSLGIVSNLARPGGNVTGVSVDAGIEIWGKRLQLLNEAIPKMSRVGLLITRDMSGTLGAAAIREAARRGGIAIVGPPLDSPVDEAAYRRVFAAMAREGAEALILSDEPEHWVNRMLVVELAEENRLPAIYVIREFVALGGLMAYAFDLQDMMRHAAQQVDQILKGVKPSEIPFYQASRFELVINLKTAKALGLTIPPSLLTVADEVIE